MGRNRHIIWLELFSYRARAHKNRRKNKNTNPHFDRMSTHPVRRFLIGLPDQLHPLFQENGSFVNLSWCRPKRALIPSFQISMLRIMYPVYLIRHISCLNDITYRKQFPYICLSICWRGIWSITKTRSHTHLHAIDLYFFVDKSLDLVLLSPWATVI